MSEVISIKAIGKKSNVYDVEIRLSCFMCGEGKSRLPKTFDNFSTLIRHIEQCHKNHVHYKTLRNGLKKFQTVTKYYTKRGTMI